ncbi:hypothetical protein PVAP13_2NG048619 [Panicum virgatum]|uniref:Uncharacterized protein n=1 Tax=Panicum virgatum TaxID=38727 RepID=A0A8T0V959_PANVG|nr:hypothetical protein PVAP13_2NG048619 [Panicum virgatum]
MLYSHARPPYVLSRPSPTAGPPPPRSLAAPAPAPPPCPCSTPCASLLLRPCSVAPLVLHTAPLASMALVLHAAAGRTSPCLAMEGGGREGGSRPREGGAGRTPPLWPHADAHHGCEPPRTRAHCERGMKGGGWCTQLPSRVQGPGRGWARLGRAQRARRSGHRAQACRALRRAVGPRRPTELARHALSRTGRPALPPPPKRRRCHCCLATASLARVLPPPSRLTAAGLARAATSVPPRRGRPHACATTFVLPRRPPGRGHATPWRCGWRGCVQGPCRGWRRPPPCAGPGCTPPPLAGVEACRGWGGVEREGGVEGGGAWGEDDLRRQREAAARRCGQRERGEGGGGERGR